DRPLRNFQQFGGIDLRQLLIPEQIEDFTLLIRELSDLMMKLSPGGEAARITRLIRSSFGGGRQAFRVRSWGSAGVVGAVAARAVVVLGEVEQFAANVQGGDAEEVRRAGRPDLSERPVQSHGGVLQDVIGLFPAPDARVALEH